MRPAACIAAVPSLKFVTVNVNTLAPKESSTGANRKPPNPAKKSVNFAHELVLSGRVALLERDLNAYGIDLVGVQESRMRGSDFIAGDFYDMHIASVTSSGPHDIQLWIRRVSKVKYLCTIASSPRMLVALVKVPGLARPLCCAVGHAPQQGNLASIIDNFWEELFDAVVKATRRAGTGTELVVLIQRPRGECQVRLHRRGPARS